MSREGVPWLDGVLDRFVEAHPQLVELARRRSDDLSVTDRRNKDGHITASACVVDPATNLVLMIFSPKFEQWLLPGGHVDPGEAPFEAALRELGEECGISADRVRTVDSAPAAIDIHTVPASAFHGEPEHRHFDLQYLFHLSGTNSLTNPVDKREVTQIAWMPKSNLALSYPELSAVLATRGAS